MSNDVCGYIFPAIDMTHKDMLKKYISTCETGIDIINKDQLYNFPKDMDPTEDLFCFLIGDRPDYPNATYLIDYCQYDPVSAHLDIGFPADPRDRLNILIETLKDIFNVSGAVKMVVAITECNQIETIKKIKLPELYDVIHADFEEYQAPPDTLYEITN
ncbi:hypothetical protein [Siccibacter turicensis]|uniref:hypothetical protein n=1 Tax=Siccibacter turicensis TaxID=357233 RepID=UPI002A69FAB9|nr:hypothetical protein [Siccibacter turicensis]MDY0972289.1 hypothetical protein [Siccibacter turicensis]